MGQWSWNWEGADRDWSTPRHQRLLSRSEACGDTPGRFWSLGSPVRKGPKTPIIRSTPQPCGTTPISASPGLWGSLKPSIEEQHQRSDGWIMTHHGGWQQRVKAVREPRGAQGQPAMPGEHSGERSLSPR